METKNVTIAGKTAPGRTQLRNCVVLELELSVGGKTDKADSQSYALPLPILQHVSTPGVKLAFLSALN